MENKLPSDERDSKNEVKNPESNSTDQAGSSLVDKKDSTLLKNTESAITAAKKGEPSTKDTTVIPTTPKKPVKPPKIEDKPFDEFIKNHFIPEIKSAIEYRGTSVSNIKLIEGKRPVVGGNCWMVFCELPQQRRFWLCFNKELITSDKTILLAESNSDPSIVESFLIDEKKTTLPLLISRVLQRLNGQKWFGAN